MSQPRRFPPRISWLVFAAFGLAASHSRVPASLRQNAAPVKVLIITGDHGHAWKDTTERLSDILGTGGKIKVDVTVTPSKDLTDENLSKYDVLLLELQGYAQRHARIALVRRQQGGVPQGRARRQGAGGLPPRLECLYQTQLG